MENKIKILFEGIKHINKIPHLKFKIELDSGIHMVCEIPSDDITCLHIMTHLQRYIPQDLKLVEPGNLEESIIP